MRKYGGSKTTRIMMATVPHVISGLGLRKFQADGFLLTRVYHTKHIDVANRYIKWRYPGTNNGIPRKFCSGTVLLATYVCSTGERRRSLPRIAWPLWGSAKWHRQQYKLISPFQPSVCYEADRSLWHDWPLLIAQGYPRCETSDRRNMRHGTAHLTTSNAIRDIHGSL